MYGWQRTFLFGISWKEGIVNLDIVILLGILISRVDYTAGLSFDFKQYNATSLHQYETALSSSMSWENINRLRSCHTCDLTLKLPVPYKKSIFQRVTKK